MGQLRRSRSSMVYNGHSDSFHKLAAPTGTLRRTTSTPQLMAVGRATATATGETPMRYCKDWNAWGDYWQKSRYERTDQSFFPYASRPGGQWYDMSADGSHWWNWCNAAWQPAWNRHDALTRSIDPHFWRRYRDPDRHRPLHYPYRPWVYEAVDKARAIGLYQQNMINYDTLERYWLAPRSWERAWIDYRPPYRPPTWFTSPCRYLYS